MIGTVELAVTVDAVLREHGVCHATFGDGSGKWIGTSGLLLSVQSRGHDVDGQGRLRGALNELVRQGRARRHPSGADYWQPIGGRR